MRVSTINHQSDHDTLKSWPEAVRRNPHKKSQLALSMITGRKKLTTTTPSRVVIADDFSFATVFALSMSNEQNKQNTQKHTQRACYIHVTDLALDPILLVVMRILCNSSIVQIPRGTHRRKGCAMQMPAGNMVFTLQVIHTICPQLSTSSNGDHICPICVEFTTSSCVWKSEKSEIIATSSSCVCW